ncbi:MAG TPA: hypothetical protein VNB22_00505 [Pyrinomonadaceae bacterium]|nr:hypothetical protein [Pyrinomonadaceae bacterium]
MKKITAIFIFCLVLFTVGGYAQKINQTAPKFSSRYTNLKRDCKSEPGDENGTDGSSECRGVGGYQIFIWYSAAAEMIAAERSDNTAESFLLDTHDIFSDYSKFKIEWRMANGKPFAVIMRVFKYGDEKKNEYDYWGKKIGEELKVIGLKGFENINFTVDAKTPDANVKARELADNGFLQNRKANS